jgi:HEAT repeat protein
LYRKLADELVRRRQVTLAGYRGDVAMVRDHLDDPEPAVRVAALGALARAGDLQAEDVTLALADPAATVRRRACELAADWPGNDGPRLVPSLSDPDTGVVEAAAWACGERTPAEPGAVAALAVVVNEHEDALCREAAVAALGALGDREGLEAILAAVTDRPAVRRRAVLALAPFDGPEVNSALRRARQDRDWQVRQAAEDLLGD